MRDEIESLLKRLSIKELDALQLLKKAESKKDFTQSQYRSGQCAILNEVIFSLNKILEK